MNKEARPKKRHEGHPYNLVERGSQAFHKLCGENNVEKAKVALDKFSSDVMETVKKLNKLGETETAAVVLQKVLI